MADNQPANIIEMRIIAANLHSALLDASGYYSKLDGSILSNEEFVNLGISLRKSLERSYGVRKRAEQLEECHKFTAKDTRYK